MARAQEESVLYVCTKLGADSSINSFKSYKGSENFEIGHVTLSHAPL